MVRVLAYCINADENLSFAKGLNCDDELDILARTLDDQIALSIDVGEPSLDRIKKSQPPGASTQIYCFN